MFKNYIRIAWRNIARSRFYSFVNMVGLSTGIAFAMIISAYVWSELRVNKDLKNASRQYVFKSRWKEANMGYELATLGPLAKELKLAHPDLVANYYRFDGVTSNISAGDRAFREGISLGDSTMLNMYGFRLKYGNAALAFREPFSVVITPEKAIKFFGKEDVVGRSLTIENFSGSKHDFLVTGVLDKPSRNSVTTLNAANDNQVYIATENLAFFGRNMSWQNPFIVNYIELQPGVEPADLQKPIDIISRKNAPDQVTANMSSYLVPLSEYYLEADNGLVRKMIYALSAVAIFILLMAVINFVNMSVSRSGSRMREIGIRKVMGGLRKQLIVQFLVESVLLVFLSTLFALFIYICSRDFFSIMLGQEIPGLLSFPVAFALLPLAFAIIVGLLAGFYPAIVLSSMKAVASLKGKLSSVKEKILLRKSLVAFQFGMATIVFTGAIIIGQQINLFFSRDLGYDKESVIVAQVPRDWTSSGVSKMLNIRKQLALTPGVQDVSLSYEIPDGNNSGGAVIHRAGTDTTVRASASVLYSDEYYASTYNIPMAAGEFFGKPGAVTDSFRVVINEANALALGWKDASAAVGQQVQFEGNDQRFLIAGVTKDFHFESMQRSIKPILFQQVGLTSTFRFFSVKLKPGDPGKSIAGLQQQWNRLMPGAPFEYRFMDDTLANVYKTELQLKRASQAATMLAMVIVLLGIMGLVSLSVQKRNKEMSIRKVLGASVASILRLFVVDFMLVILVAGIVACPVAWVIMNGWLGEYAYRISIGAMPFLIATGVLLLVTMLVICLQTMRSAIGNPVRSLRGE